MWVHHGYVLWTGTSGEVELPLGFLTVTILKCHQPLDLCPLGFQDIAMAACLMPSRLLGSPGAIRAGCMQECLNMVKFATSPVGASDALLVPQKKGRNEPRRRCMAAYVYVHAFVYVHVHVYVFTYLYHIHMHTHLVKPPLINSPTPH